MHFRSLSASLPSIYQQVGVNVRGDLNKLGRDRAAEWGDATENTRGRPTAFVEVRSEE